MRFIRKNGRIIPIRDAGAGGESPKRKGGVSPVKKGMAAGAAIGAAASFTKHASQTLAFRARMVAPMGINAVGTALKQTARMDKGKIGKTALLGSVIGAAAASLRFGRARKGESDKQLAGRMSGYKKPSSKEMKSYAKKKAAWNKTEWSDYDKGK